VSAKQSRRTVSTRIAQDTRTGFDWKSPKFLLTVGLIIVIGLIAFIPVALATDQSAFCKTCHGMVPFYDAWAQGKHAGHAECIDCHVDPGYPARFTHKFFALQEVAAEFMGKSKYPNYNAEIPEKRCLRCHPKAATAVVGKFDHSQHVGRKGVSCVKCHADTGHHVTFAALDAAGVLNTKNAPSDQTYVGQNLADSAGKGSVYPGHKAVPCQNCHDQANLQCSFCHDAPTNHFGPDCKSCHSNAAVPFKQFTHPRTKHNYLSRPCVKCHPQDFQHVYCTCHKGHPPND